MSPLNKDATYTNLLEPTQCKQKSFAFADGLFWFTDSPKNLVTIESYPRVRIRASGQSLGGRSAGQNVSAVAISLDRAALAVLSFRARPSHFLRGLGDLSSSPKLLGPCVLCVSLKAMNENNVIYSRCTL